MLRVFMDGIKPATDQHGVPWCDDRCPSHSGIVCAIIGVKPSTICEPAVRQMQEVIHSTEWNE